MEKILQELHEQIVREMGGHAPVHESLGTPEHQLKSVIEGFIDEWRANQNANPYDFTNRVLVALDQHRRYRS